MKKNKFLGVAFLLLFAIVTVGVIVIWQDDQSALGKLIDYMVLFCSAFIGGVGLYHVSYD